MDFGRSEYIIGLFHIFVLGTLVPLPLCMSSLFLGFPQVEELECCLDFWMYAWVSPRLVYIFNQNMSHIYDYEATRLGLH